MIATKSSPADRDNKAVPLAVIPKRDGEEIRVQWAQYNGFAYLDVRLYFRTPDGTMHPTRKGVTFAPDQLDQLTAALVKAKATAPGAARNA